MLGGGRELFRIFVTFSFDGLPEPVKTCITTVLKALVFFSCPKRNHSNVGVVGELGGHRPRPEFPPNVAYKAPPSPLAAEEESSTCGRSSTKPSCTSVCHPDLDFIIL